MTDKLFTAKQPDGFSHESPIRAFTDFKVDGIVAIGKGFRPSLAHLGAYLNAMHEKEGWEFVQVLLPEPPAVDPTILFRRRAMPVSMTLKVPNLSEQQQATVDEFLDSRGFTPTKELRRRVRSHHDVRSIKTYEKRDDRMPGAVATHPVPIEQGYEPEVTSDDPINPKHYAGTACAEIGERLSANAYQMLKYVWRLGRKDEPCQEIGKAIWYWKREIELFRHFGGRDRFFGGYQRVENEMRGIAHPASWLQQRTSDQPEFTQLVAGALWRGYTLQGAQHILEMLETQQKILDCGKGLAI